MFCDTREHARAYFLPVVKSKRNIRPPAPRKDAVRAFLPFDCPSDAQESAKYTRGFSGPPFHIQTNV